MTVFVVDIKVGNFIFADVDFFALSVFGLWGVSTIEYGTLEPYSDSEGVYEILES
jgi:hypothetical protein